MSTIENLESWADHLESRISEDWQFKVMAHVMREAADELQLVQDRIVDLWPELPGGDEE